MKRKAQVSDDIDEHYQHLHSPKRHQRILRRHLRSNPQPLTYANLLEHTSRSSPPACILLCSSQSQRDSQGDSTEIMSSNSGASSPSKGVSNVTIGTRLNLHRIYVNRRKTRPDSLEELCLRVTKARDGQPTPLSKKIHHKIERMPDMNEPEAIQVLGTVLGYRGEDEDLELSGTTHVKRLPDKLWSKACVPNGLDNDSELKKILKKIGSPSTPKPDYTYGYADSAFSKSLLRRMQQLPEEFCVCEDREPWFPYWIVEWKSSATGGTMPEAETQARRGGATAVNALHKLYLRSSPEPVPEVSSAMFSMCIDSSVLRIYVHWRRDDEGEVSFEADVIAECLLSRENEVFHARSVISNILDWARDERLKAIRSLLEDVLTTQSEKQSSSQSRPADAPRAQALNIPQQFTPPASTSSSDPPRKRARVDSRGTSEG